MSNLQQYNDIFCKVFNVEEKDLNSDFTFAKIEKWDSISHMTLITELEDEFGIMFDTEDILGYGSYENGIKILKKYGVEL